MRTEFNNMAEDCIGSGPTVSVNTGNLFSNKLLYTAVSTIAVMNS